jgi:fatty acid desaturase
MKSNDTRSGATRTHAFATLIKSGLSRLGTFLSYEREEGLDPRHDMDQRLALPRWLLDWFTGKPILDGKSQPTRLDPIVYLLFDMATAVIGVIGIVAVIAYLPLPLQIILVPAGWLMIVGRLRKMQTLEGHEASHGNFFLQSDPRRRHSNRCILGMSMNDFFGELATTFALSENVLSYRASHRLHHDAATYTTEKDPDALLVRSIRKNYGWHLVNPAEYLRDFGRRLRSNLIDTSRTRRIMGGTWAAILLGLIAVMPLSTWIAAIFVPWVILFRLSALLQIISLHAWLLPPVCNIDEYAERTWARFSGIRLPRRGLTGMPWIKTWLLFWAEIVLIELPFRVGVLSQDLQAHDAHHLEYLLVFDAKVLDIWVDDWRNQPYRRAEIIRDSHDYLGMTRREIWGVRAMMAVAQTNLE